MSFLDALKGMKDIQKNISSVRVEGRAGGDMVIIIINGAFEPQSVHISPEAMERGPQFLSDLIMSAMHDARGKMQSEIQQRMGASGLGALAGNLFGSDH